MRWFLVSCVFLAMGCASKPQLMKNCVETNMVDVYICDKF